MRSISGLASAASRLPASQRNLLWGVGAGLVATRVVLLAHWVSDVAAGLAVGRFLGTGSAICYGIWRCVRRVRPGVIFDTGGWWAML
jgi:membrane-associated phospholipid phosphatase